MLNPMEQTYDITNNAHICARSHRRSTAVQLSSDRKRERTVRTLVPSDVMDGSVATKIEHQVAMPSSVSGLDFAARRHPFRTALGY